MVTAHVQPKIATVHESLIADATVLTVLALVQPQVPVEVTALRQGPVAYRAHALFAPPHGLAVPAGPGGVTSPHPRLQRANKSDRK